ncbi:hypothetical protein ABZ915_09070 [Streptomyces sp. NPDC046915]|uniref:hypothetical protein n=1 Tax=Streptomyces sp. NPDC046915 TaxID=3155257 RepID=UPI0033F74609
MPNITTAQIRAEDVSKVLEQAKSIAREVSKNVFKDFQLHKAGGVQATAASGQAFKFDPSVIKYDEKGLTIAGLTVKGVPSVQSFMKPVVEPMLQRLKLLKIEEPKASKKDLDALAVKATSAKESASSAFRKAHEADGSVQRLHRTMTQKLDGIEVHMIRQAEQVEKTEREVDSLRTGARHTITEMDALLELMTDLETQVGR